MQRTAMRNNLNNTIKFVLLIIINIILVVHIAGCKIISVHIGKQKNSKSNKSYYISRKGLRLVAVLPISISGDSKDEIVTGLEQDETYHFFYKALKQRGYKVVPKKEVELVLNPYLVDMDINKNIGLIKNLDRDLNLDGVITGEIRRFSHNSWQSDPNINEYKASAHILLSLYRVRDGKKVWERVFNEAQKPFFANMAHAA